MMSNYFYPMSNWMFGGYGAFGAFTWLMPLVILDLVLKGFALWRAGRNNQMYWFIALLVINSAGILPLIYLLISQKKKR